MNNGNIVIGKRAILIAGIIVLVGLIGYYFRGLVVAATVDGQLITRVALIQALEKSSGKQALESLITEKLIAREVRNKGVIVSDTDVDARIKQLSDEMTARGGTFEEALVSSGFTLDSLKKNVRTQLEVEKLLEGKTAVTEKEVDDYIALSKLNIPKNQLPLARKQISEQLKRDKLNKEGNALIELLRSKAKISYFVKY